MTAQRRSRRIHFGISFRFPTELKRHENANERPDVGGMAGDRVPLDWQPVCLRNCVPCSELQDWWACAVPGTTVTVYWVVLCRWFRVDLRWMAMRQKMALVLPALTQIVNLMPGDSLNAGKLLALCSRLPKPSGREHSPSRIRRGIIS